jgi:putative membrane protein
MMFGYGSHWAFWQVGLMWVGMIGFWALIIWAVYALVTGATRGATESAGEQPPADSGRRILDERLAKGEIDVEEYRNRRAAMGGDDHKTPAGSAR